MLDDTFPQEHSQRRAIIILPGSELDNCYDFSPEEREFLYDTETYVLRYPLKTIDTNNSALRNILDSDQLRPNTILVQSPYERDAYVDLEQAAEAFAVEKMRHFSRLCQFLGAYDVAVEQIEITNGSTSRTFSANLKTPPLNASVNTENAEENRLSRTFAINTQFKGGTPNIVGAERYLRSKQLWGDTVMRSLVEQCADQDNPLVEQHVTISLSSESKKTLSILGNLKLPVKRIGLSTSYLKKAEANEEYSLTLRVKFAE